MSTLKTLNGWTDFADRTGRTSIYDYLHKGDIIEESLVDYFMNVMPPRAMSYGICKWESRTAMFTILTADLGQLI